MAVYLGIQRISYLEVKASKQCLFLWRRKLCSKELGYGNFPSISEIISDNNRTKCLQRIKEIKLSPRELNEDNKKRAAVLIPLCIVDNELALLYTLRRANLKRHRGQVSFPGGVEDTSDQSLEETALRETEEELGIDRDSVKVWGSGSIVIGNEFCVLPVIGYLGEIKVSDLKPNPDEVETAFSISLPHLCAVDNFRYTQFRVEKDKGYILPVFINSRFRVWGITALITHVFLNSLLPNFYKQKLEYIRPVNLPLPVL